MNVHLFLRAAQHSYSREQRGSPRLQVGSRRDIAAPHTCTPRGALARRASKRKRKKVLCACNGRLSSCPFFATSNVFVSASPSRIVMRLTGAAPLPVTALCRRPCHCRRHLLRIVFDVVVRRSDGAHDLRWNAGARAQRKMDCRRQRAHPRPCPKVRHDFSHLVPQQLL